jgi:DUF4097 and DUF4098 domain-containing protein YvlB
MRFAATALAAPICAAFFTNGAAAADLTATRTIEDSVAVAGERELVVIVDDVFGSIRVTAHDRDTVDLSAVETVRGKLQADLDRARAEVGLRTEHEPGRVAFRVRRLDGKDNGDCPCRGNRWDDYSVDYAIEIKVPRTAAVDLSTVNNGDIVVEGVQGNFDVHNVNGAVRLTGLRGSGEISTVNGTIDAAFDRAPVSATSFKTVNGKVDVTFPQNLAADLALETLHGEMLTDFDTQPVARTITNEPSNEPTRNGGKRVYSSRGPSLVRVGRGGPTYSFKTVNGAIYIRKAAR